MSSIKLTTADLEARDTAADCATIGTRIESFRTVQPKEKPRLIIHQGNSQPSAEGIVPEINAEEFNGTALKKAIEKHGALIVRNMFSSESMASLTQAADHVIDACEDPDASSNVTPGTYFNPPGNLRSIMPKGERELANTRNFHRQSGSAMCIEAPSIAEALLQFYEQHGIKEIVTDYLGEAPCLSVKKWVLRRSMLPVAEAGWHQDGAFMGADINTINMWIPLTHCGGETGAPGMDVVPQRLFGIASAEGAQFEWSVSDSHVNQSNSTVAPEFNSGDAFFFDHYFLHRTQYRPDFGQLRYAIETWFFGSSAFPKNQIPLSW